MMRRPIYILLALGLVACGDDGAAPLPSGVPTCKPEPGQVCGTAFDRHWTESGWILAPRDLRFARVAAYVPDGSGGLTAFDGSGHDDGTFTIDNVPEGEFLLAYSSVPPNGVDFAAGTETRYVRVTSDRIVDIGVMRLGRPDVLTFGADSPLELTVDGLDAWEGRDSLESISLNDAVSAPGQVMSGNDGKTSLIATVALPGPYETSTLIEADKGDRVRIVQTRLYQQPNVAYFSTTIRAGVIDAFTLITGQTNHAQVSFGVPSEQSFDLTLQETRFEALANQVFPARTEAGGGIRICGAPTFAGETALFSDVPCLVQGGAAMAHRDAHIANRFVNPFPPDWALLVTSAVSFEGLLACFSTACDRGIATIGYTAPLGSGTATIAPTLSPPQNVLINGMAVPPGEILPVGQTPTVSWATPAMGSPKRYTVRIETPYVQNGMHRLLGSITTPHTSVQIPPDILTRGTSYLLVRAFDDRAWADAMTGEIRP